MVFTTVVDEHHILKGSQKPYSAPASLLYYYSHSVENPNFSALFLRSVDFADVSFEVVVTVLGLVVVAVLLDDAVVVDVVVVLLTLSSFLLRQHEFL